MGRVGTVKRNESSGRNVAVWKSASSSLSSALLAGLACVGLTCASVLAGEPVRPRAQAGSLEGNGLGALSQRLRDGDRAAIDELLARTRPSGIDLTDSNARIEKLRAEIDQLNTRRFGRPIFQLANATPVQRGADEASGAAAAPGRVDALRESMAWLRAGEPERALRALPAAGSAAIDQDLALYLEARALEKLGRRTEALEAYRRAATSAVSPTLRTRAASDVAHLEWRERLLGAREGRP